MSCFGCYSCKSSQHKNCGVRSCSICCVEPTPGMRSGHPIKNGLNTTEEENLEEHDRKLLAEERRKLENAHNQRESDREWVLHQKAKAVEESKKNLKKFQAEVEHKKQKGELTSRVSEQKHKQMMAQNEVENQNKRREYQEELAHLESVHKQEDLAFHYYRQIQEDQLREKEAQIDSESSEHTQALQKHIWESDKTQRLELKRKDEQFNRRQAQTREEWEKTKDEIYEGRVTTKIEVTKPDGRSIAISETAPGGLATQIIREQILFPSVDAYD